jgi:hypothetical protein
MGQVAVVGWTLQSRYSKCMALIATGGGGSATSAAVAGAAVLRDDRALSDRHRGVCHHARFPTSASQGPISDQVAAAMTAGFPSGQANTFAWSWRGTSVPVGYELSGSADAEPILLLPAMSTVSTRDELKALAQQLKTCRCIITDWPGFGDTAQPRLDYDPDLCRGFPREKTLDQRCQVARKLLGHPERAVSQGSAFDPG